MKVILHSLSIFSSPLLLVVGTCQADDLEQIFSNPPDSAKPGSWWHWMGCNITKTGITCDLEAYKQAGTIKRKTSGASPAAFESDVLKTGLALYATISKERVVHTGGGKDANALFNGKMKNGTGGDNSQDGGKTFRGYGTGSVLTIQLSGPHDLTEIRTFARHTDDEGSSELRVPPKASAVVAGAIRVPGWPDRFQCVSRDQSRGNANNTEMMVWEDC